MEKRSLKSCNHSFPGFGLFIVTLGAFGLPTIASATAYTAAIVVKDGSGTTLGYLQDDPAYWTPQITANINSALIMDFTLNGTSGSQINLTPENSSEAGFPYFGAVQGRDSTDANIGSGNFNYLYLGTTNATLPGSTPQSGNYYSTANGLDHPSESAIWTIDLNALTLVPVWVNTDSSTPATVTFVQSNHVYAGGDANAFHTRFPAPVTSVTLELDILSSVSDVPEPASFFTLTLGLMGLAVLGWGKRSRRQSRT